MQMVDLHSQPPTLQQTMYDTRVANLTLIFSKPLGCMWLDVNFGQHRIELLESILYNASISDQEATFPLSKRNIYFIKLFLTAFMM